MRRRAVAVAALGATLTVAAGCAGGGDGFRHDANAICAEFEAEIDAVETPTSFDQLNESAAQVADLLEEATAELRELDPPGDLEDAYGDWLDLNDAAVANARKISDAAEQEDQAQITELAGLAEQNEQEADALAEQLDLDECKTDEPATETSDR